MNRVLCVALGLLVLAATATICPAEPQAPPQFESGYKLPATSTPPARAWQLEYVDVAVLAAAMLVAAGMAHYWRSRKGMVGLMVFSLLYFGFYKKGCVCAIGAIQNVALGLAEPSYAVPMPVILFFVLPLVFALLFGRVFCAGVCPMGALQDLVLLRPVRLPVWIAGPLRLLAYVYLAAAVLLAATGVAFVICQYDPFVGFFRLSAAATMIVLGGAMVLLSMFVGRPYCRFLCPLGVLLGHASRLSFRRVTITPRECTRCRLCEKSCPFGAIKFANVDEGESPIGQPRKRSNAVLAALVALAPVLTAGGAYVGHRVAMAMADSRLTSGLAQTDALMSRFEWGGWILGALLGLVIAVKLLQLSAVRRRVSYEADRSACLACGRCFDYCPIHRAAKEEKRRAKSANP